VAISGRKYRQDRPPTLPLESPWALSLSTAGLVSKHLRLAGLIWRLGQARRRLKRDPQQRPVVETELARARAFQR
jgi:hypothetical protein